MIKEEKFIRERFGQKHPFRVPDGYFDSFASQLMEELPENQGHVISPHTTIWRRFHMQAVAAACVLAIISGAGLYLFMGESAKSDGSVASYSEPPKSSFYSDIDAAVDYAMMDNDDIYAYVSNNLDY